MPSSIADKGGLAAAFRSQYKERRFFDANETHADSMGRVNFDLVMPPIIADLAIGPTTIGLVNAGGSWGVGWGELLHARLSDRVSPRLLVIPGGVLTAACTWLTRFGASTVT